MIYKNNNIVFSSYQFHPTMSNPYMFSTSDGFPRRNGTNHIICIHISLRSFEPNFQLQRLLWKHPIKRVLYLNVPELGALHDHPKPVQISWHSKQVTRSELHRPPAAPTQLCTYGEQAFPGSGWQSNSGSKGSRKTRTCACKLACLHWAIVPKHSAHRVLDAVMDPFLE